MKKQFATIIFLLIGVFLANTLIARNYRVNVLIFTQANRQNLQSEQWTPQLIQPKRRNWRLLQTPTGQSDQVSDYTLLTQSKDQLRGLARYLAKRGKHIILDVAWMQSNAKAAQWVHLYGGKAYDASGNVMPDVQSTIHGFAQNPDVAYWAINGAIKMVFGRFITAKVQMNYTVPVSMVSGISNADFGQAYGLVPLQSFAMTQTQRILLNHFVYFDHPLFGVLVYVQRADHAKSA